MSPITRFANEMLDIIGGKPAEIADKVGVSDQSVRFWRSGDREPGLSNLITLCEVAGQPHRKHEARALVLAKLESPEPEAA